MTVQEASPGSSADRSSAVQPPKQPQAAHGNAHRDMHHEKTVRNALLMIVIVIALGLLLAFLATKYLKTHTVQKVERTYYNGFEFIKSGDAWLTQWQRGKQNYTLTFHYLPWEVENITVQGRVDDRFKLWPTVFITVDPENESKTSTKFLALAAADTATFLSSPIFGRNVLGACTANVTEVCATRPIVTCSTNSSVVYLKVSNETGIFLDGNCATFQGYDENIRKVEHKAIYQWLGIITK